jgi:hypothetical protein
MRRALDAYRLRPALPGAEQVDDPADDDGDGPGTITSLDPG